MARLAITKEQETLRSCKALTERCDALRRANKIPQKKLAEYTGKSQPRICYELNHCISIETLVAIAKLTGTEIGI